MIKELSLSIIKIKQETHDVKSFILDISNEEFNYKPGQFIALKLDANDPEGNIKAFSLASSPTENEILMISTKITETPFKQKLNSLKIGDSVSIKGPYGYFILIENAKEIVMLGGGIGITPFRNMIKYSTDKKLPIKITLLYSNKTPEDIVYKDEWALFEKQNPNLIIVNTITRPEELKQPWHSKIGRIDEKFIRDYVQDLNTPIYYICGPVPMVDSMFNLLNEIKIPQNKVKIERFFGY